MATHQDPKRLAEQALGLRAFAASLVHGHDPDDLVQQTALTALEAASPHDAREPWLRHVLRNHARLRHRSTQRQRRRDAALVAEHPTGTHEQELFRAQLLATLGQALAELDEPYRQTLMARFLQGRSAAEIARRTETPATTVRSRIQRALDELRRTLDDRFGGRHSWCPALILAVDDLPPLVAASPAASSSASTAGAMMIKTIGVVGVAAAASAALTWAPMDSAAPTGAEVAEIATEAGSMAEVELDPDIETDAKTRDGERPSSERLPVSASTSAVTHEQPIPGAWGEALKRLEEAEQIPMLITLHGGAADDYDRAERLGLFAVCEDMVLPVQGRKVVAFEVEWEGHRNVRMDLIRDDLGEPEIVDCIRGALAELGEEKKLEYPDYDERGWNIAGAIFGGEPRPPLAAHVVPEELPLVTDAFPRRGTEDAAVTMVVCGDYDSKFTRGTASTIADVQSYFADRLQIVWLQAPLTRGASSLRARAAVSARTQGMFWAMHERLMAAESIEDETALLHLAEDAGLDLEEFSASLGRSQTTEQVQRQLDTCNAHGAMATPFFFIGDEPIAGAVSFDRLVDSIEASIVASARR